MVVSAAEIAMVVAVNGQGWRTDQRLLEAVPILPGHELPLLL